MTFAEPANAIEELNDLDQFLEGASGCPNCGSPWGMPVMVYSSEYQGDSPHGGIVEWEDECCTECVRRRPE